ncbi:MAG: Yip1 family protein, partial [Promethearchaeota archaeon]
MFAYGIFKVIYAPFKAFKEIIQNPRYIGPILVMILFIVANVGFVYAAVSRTYVEQTLPTGSQLDEWTENCTLWTSGPGVEIRCSGDHIDGSYYGNKSIEFSIADRKQIWMRLNTTEPVNCSIEGYKNMSFRVKLIPSTTTDLNNASILLQSSPADYFLYDMTEHFTPFNSDLWNNLTIAVGPESGHWMNSTANADWSNITSLKFEFTWSENTNVTVRLDGLFFRGIFKSLAEDASIYILNFSVSAFMQFTIKWVLLTGLLYIIGKTLGAKTVWKTLLILVGFALITLFIQALITAATYATLPTLYYPLELIGGVQGESEIAYDKILEDTWLVSQVNSYVQIAIHIWTISLCAIALRLLAE